MTASLTGQAGPAHLAEARRLTERRLVSVLFADLVGFTSLSADEDPEAVREFLSAWFERASEVILRYGGTVEKFIGDAVMAVWGAPRAHEDDAERAVRAALDLVSMMRGIRMGGEVDAPRLRAAVMTGEAAVTAGAQGQGLVAGDLVNTSSRLQSAAAPGSVLVDETTMVAAGRAVAFESAGQLTLRGKDEPMKAWMAIEVVAERGGMGRPGVLEPPFVGRHEELRLLKDSLHATSREGKSRLLTVIGHAGYGKSRLAWELRKYTDGLAETVYWHEGQSPAYGEGVAYWALGEMVRGRCRIGDTSDAESARARLAESLAEFVPGADERDWIEPRLAALLGLAEAPGGDREELFAAWRTFFERIAAKGTVALIFEDLHWADESLFEFLDHLLEWSRDHPILVVGLARPELLERRPGWGSRQRAAATVHLEPLADEPMGDLLRGLVPGLPEPVLTSIVSRAEGVPLYAVETVRMLLDEGRLVRDGERYRLVDSSVEVAVPASLQALISARLDALGPAERSLVQDAAVLGKSFTRSALGAVSGASAADLDGLLEQLIRKEIFTLERQRGSGEREQYAFVQSLLREVAYSTLSRRDRRDRHLAAAGYYEALGDDELAGLVASHFLDAYRSAPGGPDGEAAAAQARVALRAAAERSISLHANTAAVTFIEEALSVTGEPEERARLWVMAAAPAWASTDGSVGERYIRDAIEWYTADGRDEEADDAVATLAAYLVSTSRSEEAVALLADPIGRIDDSSARPSAPRLLNEQARANLFLGRLDDGAAAVERGLAIAEHLMAEAAIAELLATKAWSLGLRGRHRESIVVAEGGLRLAQRHGLVQTQLRVRMNLSDLSIGVDPRRGYQIAQEGVELAERYGQGTWAVSLAANEGFAALLLGEWEQPIARAEELVRPHLIPLWRAGLEGIASVARAHLGRPGPSVSDVAEAADIKGPELIHVRSWSSALKAFEAYAAGDLDAVDGLTMRAAEGTAHFSEAVVAVCFAVHATTWLRERGRLAAALEHLDGLAWPTDVKATTVTQGRAALLALDGSPGAALDGFREALAAWRRLDMQPDIATTEMEMLALLGDVLPDREGLAAEARAILTDLGAVVMLGRLDEVVQPKEAVEVAT